MSKRSTRKKRQQRKNGLDSNLPLVQYYPPEQGEYIAWKKVAIKKRVPTSTLWNRLMMLLHLPKYIRGTRLISDYSTAILKLRIPADAKRICPNGGKCRSDCAFVEEVQTMNGKPLQLQANQVLCSLIDSTFFYNVGEMVYPERGFDDDPRLECSSGIHHFMNRKKARHY